MGHGATLKQKSSTLLLAACAAWCATGVAAQQLPYGGEPISGDVDEDGWYAMEWVATNQGSQYIGCFLFNAEEEKLHNKYYFPLCTQDSVDTPAYNDATYYIYLKRGFRASIRSANGHWISSEGKSAPEPYTVMFDWKEDQGGYLIGNGWIPFESGGGKYAGISQSRGGNDYDSRIRLYKVDVAAAGLDVYTVNITGDPAAGRPLHNLTRVSTTSPYAKGLKRVYNGGSFFVESGHALTPGDISAEAVYGVEPRVSVDGDTINVEYYTLEEARAMARGVLALKGPGYYKDGVSERTTLSGKIEEAGATAESVVKAVYEYKDRLYQRDIYLPEPGKSYTLTNVQADGRRYHLCHFGGETLSTIPADSSATPPAAAIFTCHSESESSDKRVFFTHGGRLLYVNDSYPTKLAVTPADYASTYCSLEIDRAEDFGYGTTSAIAYKADLYGMLFMSGWNESVVVDSGGVVLCQRFPYYETGKSSAFIMEETPYYNRVETHEAAGKRWGTICLPFATTAPAGVTLYKGVVNTAEGKVDLVELDSDVLPANTAAVFTAEDASPVVFAPKIEKAGLSIDGNSLCGTMEADKAVTAGKRAYVLNSVGGVPGFYRYSGATLPAGKAYIELDESYAAKAMPFSFRETTGVSSARAAMGRSDVYDLQGRRVAILARGLYIVGGKKVVVK